MGSVSARGPHGTFFCLSGEGRQVTAGGHNVSRKPVQARMQSHDMGGPGAPIGPEAIMVNQAEGAWAEAIAFTREKSSASFDQWF